MNQKQLAVLAASLMVAFAPTALGQNSTTDECDDYSCSAWCKEEAGTTDPQKCKQYWCENNRDECETQRDDSANERQAHCDNATSMSEKQECHERFCKDNPSHERCKQDEKPETTPGPDKPSDGDGSQDGKPDGDHGEKGDEKTGTRPEQKPEEKSEDKPDGKPDDENRPDQRPSSKPEPEPEDDETDGVVTFNHVSFHVDREARVIEDYTVNGHLMIKSIDLSQLGELEAERHGKQLVIEGDDGKLVIRDTPTGIIAFKLDGPAIVITLPDDSKLDANGRGADNTTVSKVQLPSGVSAVMRANGVTMGDGQFTVYKQATMLLPPGQSVRDDPEPQKQPNIRDQPKVTDAAKEGRLGAAVKIAKAKATESQLEPEVSNYDDVELVVTDLPEVATKDAPIRVEVSAELLEGRTISIELDPELFPGIDASNLDQGLDLRYFDVNEDGTETEIVFRQAGSLDDVLDSVNDNGQPEYWVVLDATGLQVLVSVPHWSTHAVTLASIVEVLTKPSVQIGITLGFAIALAATAAMLKPRRQEF